MRSANWLLFASLLLVVDQLLKWLAVVFRPSGQWLYYIENTGATFGLFQGANTVLAILSVLVIGLLLFFLFRSTTADSLGLSLVLAGVSGNFLDRVFRGFVVDYIRVGSFPIFNLADMLIVGGVLLLLIFEIPSARACFEKRFSS